MYHKYLSTLLFTLICLLIFLTHPIKTLAQTSLQISNISDNRSNYPNQEIPKYEKFEVTFNINDTVATNFQFPYDGQVVPNLINRVGITVDGLFLPPGESDWNNALVQPGFLYQPTLRDSNVGEYDWIYPTGEVYWILRFSPKQQGAWKYKIRAQDDSICSGANPCNNWVESPEYQFTATGSLPDNNGFVEVSPYDSRYFMFSDESQFFGLGHAGPSLTPLKSAETYLEEQNQKDVDVIRAWMSASLIVSRGTHWWDPWREVRWADQITADAGVPGVPYGDHDLAVKIGGNGDYIFMTADGNQYISTGLEANKDYIIRIRAKLENVTPSASGSGLKGLVAKVVNNPGPCAATGEPNFGCNFLNQGNTLLYLTPTAEI